MAVLVNSGPVPAFAQPRSVPVEKWPELVRARRDYLGRSLSNDCRCLLEYVRDAEELWKPLGYESADDLIRRGYEVEPSEVRLAVEWLKIREPTAAVRFADAVAAGKHGGDRKSPEAKDQVDNVRLIPPTDKGGNSPSYAMARLLRDAPELAALVRAGELTAHAAAIQAGFRKRTVTLPLDPQAWARAAVKHMTREQVRQLAADLGEWVRAGVIRGTGT